MKPAATIAAFKFSVSARSAGGTEEERAHSTIGLSWRSAILPLGPAWPPKKNPAAGGARGGAFNGRFALESYVLNSEPSVDARMTR